MSVLIFEWSLFLCSRRARLVLTQPRHESPHLGSRDTQYPAVPRHNMLGSVMLFWLTAHLAALPRSRGREPVTVTAPEMYLRQGLAAGRGSPAGLCFSITLRFGLFFPFSAAHSWYKGFDTRRLSETGDTRCWYSSGYTYYAEAFTLTDHEHVAPRFFFLSLFFSLLA